MTTIKAKNHAKITPKNPIHLWKNSIKAGKNRNRFLIKIWHDRTVKSKKKTP